MASKTLSLSFLIFFFCADGRSLQKNYADESVNPSHGFSLQATNNTGKTNDNDVLGLSAITTGFPLSYLDIKGGDPCQPPRWAWIECSSDPRPRVLALNLRNQFLSGIIPDFSSMDALQRIDLSFNYLLTGSIPSFLGTFPDLQKLDLSSTYVSGLIPDSLACKKNKKLIFTFDRTLLYVSNNCSTSNNNPSPSTDINPVPVPATITSKKSSLPAILGGTISSFGVFWIALGIFMLYRHKHKTAAAIAQTSVAMS